MSKVKLRVTGVPEHFNLPWILAIDDGAFEEAGIDLEWIDEPGGTGAMSAALFHGDVDVALLLTEGALTSVLTGNPSKIHSLYVSSPLIWGVFAGARSRASLSELQQQAPYAISRFYSGSHLMAFVYADQVGREIKKEDFNCVGTIDGAEKSLQDHADQLFLWEKYITMPYVQKGDFKLIDEVESPWSSFVVVVRDTVEAAQREALDKALEIVRQYALDLQFSEEEGAELIAMIYDMKKADARSWLDHVHFSSDGNYDLEMLQEVAMTLHRLGILQKKPTLTSLQERCIQA